MNCFHLSALLRHLLFSQSSAGYGVHSPFIYEFLTTVVRGKTSPYVSLMTEGLRKTILADFRLIDINDSWTVSGGREETRRTVHDIAAKDAVSPRQAAMLARIAAFECSATTPDDGIILELGTSLGISTLCLAMSAPQNRIITIEGSPAIADIARENFRLLNINNVEVLTGGFPTSLKQLSSQGVKVRYAFIDGIHSGDALVNYFGIIMGMASETITIVADDIHLNRSMYKGWKMICNDNRGDASVEMFRFGVIFCKKALTPGRYKIKR